jgi:hypothetical protein
VRQRICRASVGVKGLSANSRVQCSGMWAIACSLETKASSCSSRTMPSSRMRSHRISSQRAGALFFDREIKRITEITWDQAVDDTANLWQSIFWNALGLERAWELYGIAAPLKAIGIASHC